MNLPRLLMRRAAAVAAAVLVLAVLLGLWRLNRDIDEEVDAGQHLARVMATLGQAASLGDAQLLDALKALLLQGRLRHVALELRDARGAVLLTHGPAGPARAWPWQNPPELRMVAWALPRPDGGNWQVRLRASRDGERNEALVNLGGMLGLLLLCVAGLLLSMRWNLRHALRPLSQLLSAMAGIGRGDLHPLRTLPPMPVTELQAVAGGLQQLTQALDQAQAQRRALSGKMLTLQEEERGRIAHELHDELGQRVTALRLGTAHLLRGLGPDAALRPELLQLQSQCEQLQHDVRHLLAGLQPFDEPGGQPDTVPLERLVSHLNALVASWNRDAGAGLQVQLRLAAFDSAGQPRPWPQPDEVGQGPLPLTLAQALYRISQESLTNVARHAGASLATLSLELHPPRGHSTAHIAWRALDNGRGIADPAQALQRGNGLAGIHQRVWAAGGDLSVAPASTDPATPGLVLSARFALPAPAPAA
ncbi:signal transduction histidine kinase [Burkholderiales bacterium JOSHI_001]|nr:signal transduction histidine kinase [Burkholderiales bacterium JOSHI_001]